MSIIVVIPNKNGQLHVPVEYRKLNAQKVVDPFPLPFSDAIVDTMAGYELCSFLDGFSCYNYVWLTPEDHEKNRIRHRLGCIRCSGHDVWPEDSLSHFPVRQHENIRGIHSMIHAGIHG